MLSICFLSSMHTPFDKRVFEKEARSLAVAGFSVTHIAPGDGTEFVANDVRIVTYPGRKGLFGRILQLRLLYKIAVSVGAEVYHCNELDSWLIGLFLKAFHGSKCVVDIHEHYPEEFAEVRFPNFLRGIVRRLVAFGIWGFSQYTDRVVVAKSSLLYDFKYVPDEKLVLVQNFSPLRNFSVDLEVEPKKKLPSQEFRMIHLGLFGVRRGWPQLLKAMKILDDRDIKLLIVGEIADGSEKAFRQQCIASGLGESIEMIDWLPIDEAMELVKTSHLGLILFQPDCHNHVHALPHKLFDYMGAAVPVLVPQIAVEVVEIVSKSDCGLCIDSGSPEAIATAIREAKANTLEMVKKGENGRAAVFNEFNWENEEARLIQTYSAFSQAKAKSARLLD
jgi:glycosyltransferase involved in cell wall biosynthesis